MRIDGTTPSGGATTVASTTGRAQPAATAAVSHEKSSDSLASNDMTGEESKPLVSSRNQPYLDYGATGMPALRIETLSKVSLRIN